MKIRQKHIGILIVAIIWLLLFFDDYSDSIWYMAISATIRVAVIVAAARLFRYYYQRMNIKPRARLYLIIWFILLGLIISVLEFYLVEDYSLQTFFSEEMLDEKIEFDEEVIELSKELSTMSEAEIQQYLTEYEEGDIGLMDYIFFIVFSYIVVVLSMTISWAFLMFKKNKENELAISRLEALNKTSELTHLKSQLNPHFLFNALSNIYSIAYLGDKETPDKIMQLSKMLRYVIYDTNVDFISLSKEIEYLNLYIEFQRFKIKQDQNISFDYSSCNENDKIAPLLLLPFVENSFKHSQLATDKNAWVKIKLTTEKKAIFFEVENSISMRNKPEILNNYGIGMENIKKRLQIIYKDAYDLSIEADETYKVTLSLNWHD